MVLLITISIKRETAKSDVPSRKLQINPSRDGKRTKVENPTTPIQRTAIPTTALLKDGRKNKEE
jgi:hypothetical protein